MSRYRWTSNKRAGDGTKRIILEGPKAEPVRAISLGGEGELTDDEHEKLSKRHRFTALEKSEDKSGGSGEGRSEPQPKKKSEPLTGFRPSHISPFSVLERR